MIAVNIHFNHRDQLFPRCDHTKLATIFCSCPLCKEPLNSTQAVANDHHGHATPAVFTLSHDNLNATGGQDNHGA